MSESAPRGRERARAGPGARLRELRRAEPTGSSLLQPVRPLTRTKLQRHHAHDLLAARVGADVASLARQRFDPTAAGKRCFHRRRFHAPRPTCPARARHRSPRAGRSADRRSGRRAVPHQRADWARRHGRGVSRRARPHRQADGAQAAHGRAHSRSAAGGALQARGAARQPPIAPQHGPGVRLRRLRRPRLPGHGVPEGGGPRSPDPAHRPAGAATWRPA